MKETEYETVGRNLMIRLGEELDHHKVKHIIREIQTQSSLHFSKYFIFDFADVNFMDSSGIGLLLDAYKRTVSVGGNVQVCNLSKRMDMTLRAAGMYRFVHVMK